MAISIDSILNSSFIFYLAIAIFILSAYLKRSGKTFLEFCRDIKEFFNELTGDEE
jgi:hypothetical protein